MHFQRWTDTMTLLIVSPLHNFTLTDISPPNQQAGRRGTLKTFLNSPHLWRSRRELKVPPTAKRLNHGQSNIETIKHANLPWHIKFFFGLFDQMSEESQVSKFTLSVQILKCHWQRQPGAGANNNCKHDAVRSKLLLVDGFTWYIRGEQPSGVSLLRNIRAGIVWIG